MWLEKQTILFLFVEIKSQTLGIEFNQVYGYLNVELGLFQKDKTINSM